MASTSPDAAGDDGAAAAGDGAADAGRSSAAKLLR
jgi:hypothetical protein